MTTNDAQILDEPHSLVGKDLEFQDEGKGQIVAETDDSIFILSRFFTGWMLKTEYFDLLGVDD